MNRLSYGFQSDQVLRAIELIKKARNDQHKVVIAFTGNMISSGIRQNICELVKNRQVDALITNGAGVEEDIIKTFGSYKCISFKEDPKNLLDNKLYRIGNLGVDHRLYDEFYDFLKKNYTIAISSAACDQTPGSISKQLGALRGDRDSFLFWTHKNNIELFCPTFHDGAFGDFFVDYREAFPNYRIDFLYENVKLTKLLNQFKKCGIIILGGGTSKHFALNNSILRGGYDWSVVISTAIPYDGSDSGGDADEARSWGKLKLEGESVHIFSDATLVFPDLTKKAFFD